MRKLSIFAWQHVLTHSVSLYRKNFERFLQPITIQILLALLILIIQTFDFPFHTAVYTVAAIISFIASIWLVVVFLNISQSVHINHKPTPEQIYQKSLARLPQFAAVSALSLMISTVVFMTLYIIWAIIAASLIGRLINGDPAQYLNALQNTLTYDPAGALQMLNPGIVGLLILGLLCFVPAAYMLVRYFFAMVHSAISNENEPVMKIFAHNYKLTKNKFWSILTDYAVPMIIISACQSIVMIGLGSIVTAGKYDMLELSGNIYYNILSIVVAGLFAPLAYLVIISTFHKNQQHLEVKKD